MESHVDTVLSIARMSLEIFVAFSIKLFIENGRVRFSDLKNDLFFWLPGQRKLPGDGLTREAQAAVVARRPAAPIEVPLAAK